MSGYVLGSDAERDLDDLWEYIAADSIDAADRLTARFFWPVGEYLIIYLVWPLPVEIVAVVRGSRDIPAFLSHRSA